MSTERICFSRAVFLAVLLALPDLASSATLPARQAQAQANYERASQMKRAIEAERESERSKAEYEECIRAFREVYHLSPSYTNAPAALTAVAELYQEMGRVFSADRYYLASIEAYRFLASEYPQNRISREALFRIGEIYRADLGNSKEAQKAFEKFLEQHPDSDKAEAAKEELGQLTQRAHVTQVGRRAPEAAVRSTPTPPSRFEPESQIGPASHEVKKPGQPTEVLTVRRWAGPNSNRIVIGVDAEVKYEATRLANPDRIVLDIPNTLLSHALVGKSLSVEDGVLHRVRVAQFKPNVTRVVLDVARIGDYSVFTLPNPFRLIIDVRGPLETAKLSSAPAAAVSSSGARPERVEPKAAAREIPSTPVPVILPPTVASPQASGTSAQKTNPLAAKKAEADSRGAASKETTQKTKKTQANNGLAKPSSSTEEKRAEASATRPSVQRAGENPAEKKAVEQGALESPPTSRKTEGPAKEIKENAARRSALQKPATSTDAMVSNNRVTEPAPAPARQDIEKVSKQGAAKSKSEPAATKPAETATLRPSPVERITEPKIVLPAREMLPTVQEAIALPAFPPGMSAVKDRSTKAPDKTEGTAKKSDETLLARSLPRERLPVASTKSLSSQSGEAPAKPAAPMESGSRTLTRALGLKVAKIVIDPGHGGHDTGTIGPGGLREKDLALDVGLRLKALIEQELGSRVIMTRGDDTFIPLEERTAIANRSGADLFISIHANASRDHSARGIETYYLNFTSNSEALEVAARENATSSESVHQLQDLIKKIALTEKIEESHEFAREVEREFHDRMAKSGFQQRDRGVKKAPFVVLIGANMPSILTEISFLTNPRDEKHLKRQEYRQKIAAALYQGLIRYTNSLGGVKVAQKARAGEPVTAFQAR